MRTIVPLTLVGALACLALPGAPVLAEQPVNPDWPCVQPKVPELTVGQMWSGPLPSPDVAIDPAAADLARRIAPRSVSDAKVQSATDAYLATIPSDARTERLAEVFAAVLQRINAERNSIITGISRYSHRQIEMADRIAAREATLADLEKIPEDQRDMDKFEEEQDAFKWDTRVYRDRQQSLSYVCESPTLLEQRAFSIARLLQGMI